MRNVKGEAVGSRFGSVPHHECLYQDLLGNNVQVNCKREKKAHFEVKDIQIVTILVVLSICEQLLCMFPCFQANPYCLGLS